jgi:predicted RecB family endonuclease
LAPRLLVDTPGAKLSPTVRQRDGSQGAPEIPQLAEQLGVGIVTLRVFGPDHVVLAVVEADDIEAVRDFVFQTGLIQWNTTRIHATYSMEEALARANDMEAIF